MIIKIHLDINLFSLIDLNNEKACLFIIIEQVRDVIMLDMLHILYLAFNNLVTKVNMSTARSWESNCTYCYCIHSAKIQSATRYLFHAT